MHHTKYAYRSEGLYLVYKFNSKGPKGTIKKLVIYTQTASENVYNLAFGDYDSSIDDINDLSVTNNGDSAKVLATVASTVYAFTEKYPKAWIAATGSTEARTRLYRMGISNNLDEICEDFLIFGYSEARIWEEFTVGKNYTAFLLTKRENELSI